MKTLFIAEIGNNHNGSLERAFSLIDECKSAGADVAKFQLRNLDVLYRDSKVEDLGVEYNKDLLLKYNLSFDDHKRLAMYCADAGIEYMCTPWDVTSVEQLETLGVKRYKISSADFDNFPLIEKVAQTGKPVIFSTGMNTFTQIQDNLIFIDRLCNDYTLLHCNSTYPAPYEDIELKFIDRLRELHPKVGYSGHERGIAVSLAAVAMGATVIERHVTLDKELEGPDHQASLMPHEMKALIEMIREIEPALLPEYIEERKVSQGALLNKENLGKSIVVKNDLSAGTVISTDLLEIRAPGQGMAPKELPNVVGRVLIVDLKKHDFLYPSHFSARNDNDVVIKLDSLNWGVPVRPHDAVKFHSIFNAPVYEFHISYKDLQNFEFDESLNVLATKKILVHAPELFEDSNLLDIANQDQKIRRNSLMNLQRVCDLANELHKRLALEHNIGIIANVGGFSIHDFVKKSDRENLYQNVNVGIQSLDAENCEILPQNMAPFPWHFGGQRYQNIFMEPEEIAQFCKTTSTRICLDTAHLYMYANHFKRPFRECFDIISPFAAHLHLSDAVGSNGEGVTMGTGDVDFSYVLSKINNTQTTIVETWQGHKNDGLGFSGELQYLMRIMKA